MMIRRITGVAFNHPRIIEPLRASAQSFMEKNPRTRIDWVQNSLAEFEETSLRLNSERYDIFAFDHPLIGDSLVEGGILDLEEIRPGLIESLQERSLGFSLDSYIYSESLLGVPFDGASQNSAWVRSKFTGVQPPTNFSELSDFVDANGRTTVALPLSPTHASCTFLTIAASSLPILDADDFLMDRDRLVMAHSNFKALVGMVDPISFSMNPISLLAEMSEGSSFIFSPYVFGYGIYSSSDFASNPLSFGAALSVDGSPASSIIGGAGIAISKKTHDPDLAMDYLDYLVSDASMTEIVGPHRGQGGIESGWGDGANEEMSEYFFGPTYSSMKSAFIRPRYSGFVNFLSELGSYLTSSVAAGTDSEIAAKKIIGLFEDYCVVDPLLSERAAISQRLNIENPSSKLTGGLKEAGSL